MSHPLQRVEHGRWPHRTVEADNVGAHGGELLCKGFYRGTVDGLRVVTDRHLCDHGELAALADRAVGGRELGGVGKGLEHESVDAPLEEPLDLRPEVGCDLLATGRSPRFHTDPQGAYGAQHERRVSGGLHGQQRGCPIDFHRPIFEPVRGKLHEIRSEGVRLDQLRPGFDVCAVDAPHELGLLQCQSVVAHVHEDPLGVQHRTHRAVEDVDPVVLDELEEGGGSAHPKTSAEVGGWAADPLERRRRARSSF